MYLNNIIFITNKFKDDNDNLNEQKADTNIFTIYYENEDYNIKIFKLIFDFLNLIIYIRSIEKGKLINVI